MNKLNYKVLLKNQILYIIILFNINIVMLVNILSYSYNYFFNKNYYMLGRLGEAINNYTITKGFGISIVILPITYFIYSINFLLYKKKYNITKIVFKSILLTILVSLICAYIYNDKLLISGFIAIVLIRFIKLHIGDFGICLILGNIFFVIGLFLFKKYIPKSIINNNTNVHILNKSTPLSYHCNKKYRKTKNIPKLKIDLLSDDNNNQINHKQNIFKNKLIYILKYYKIKIKKIKITTSYSTILYEITPEIGIKISQIINLKNEIALYLSVNNIFINTSSFNKGVIGIAIPNTNANKLYLKNIISSNKFINTKYCLPLILGQNINNHIVILDLIDMPHLLIAGATGQGKSVMINSIIVTLLYKKPPEELKFIMIDPKKVELSLYKNLSKFYLIKYHNKKNIHKSEYIITSHTAAISMINSLCVEMYNRYNILNKNAVKNIQEYNLIANISKLPYIILIIDEFADLILHRKNDIEKNIIKLSQLSRAVGIHIIIATQRPSTNIITGLIKNNFIYRIAFKVGSNIDSRIILDQNGAEKLQGKGDMLLYNGHELLKLQAPYITTNDIKNINNYFFKIKNKTNYNPLSEYILYQKP